MNEILKVEKLNPDDLPEVAKRYAEVFAGPPWNEFTWCKKLGIYLGLETQPGEKCSLDCMEVLDQAYPEIPTIATIGKELSMPNSLATIVRAKGRIIAFTWGYTYSSPEEFVETKYNSADNRSSIIELLKTEGINREFFYYSECGVIPSSRGKGLSNLIAQTLFEQADRLGQPVVLRSNQDSPMTAVAERFGMQQLLGPRVLVNRNLKRLSTSGEFVNGYRDSDNPQRVLYSKKSIIA